MAVGEGGEGRAPREAVTGYSHTIFSLPNLPILVLAAVLQESCSSALRQQISFSENSALIVVRSPLDLCEIKYSQFDRLHLRRETPV